MGKEVQSKLYGAKPIVFLKDRLLFLHSKEDRETVQLLVPGGDRYDYFFVDIEKGNFVEVWGLFRESVKTSGWPREEDLAFNILSPVRDSGRRVQDSPPPVKEENDSLLLLSKIPPEEFNSDSYRNSGVPGDIILGIHRLTSSLSWGSYSGIWDYYD